MRYFWTLVILGLFSSSVLAQDADASVEAPDSDELSDPLVRISQGYLRGLEFKTRGKKEYFGFQNIPYAVAERFEAPTPAPDWTGLRNAAKEGPICLQFDLREMKVEGQEDCLRANVFTPYLPPQEDDGTVTNSSALLPVLVHVHGGSFFYESGNEYKPDYLLDENLVLVTFNYRLGPFGFLSTGDSNIPGNFGLKDQVALLEWVQKNIQFFGGDPKRVTLMGGDAGGVSTSLHLLSPSSKGLFHRAIVQSGNALCPWAIERKPIEKARDLGALVDCPFNNSLTFTECIKKKNAMDIVITIPMFFKWFLDPISPFAPTIEVPNAKSAFLTRDPEELWQNGPSNPVPLIIGMTKDEGTAVHSEVVLMNPSFTKQLNEEWDTYAPITLHYEPSAANSKLIRRKYFGKQDINNSTRDELANLYTDRNYGTCTREAALAHAKHSNTYLYQYSYVGEYSALDTLGVPESDYVAHGDDQLYLFNNTKYFSGFTPNSDSEKMSKKLVRIVTSFAQDGRPTDIGSSTNFVWSPITRIMVNYPRWFRLDLNANRFISLEADERLDFWRRFNGTGANSILEEELDVGSSNNNQVGVDDSDDDEASTDRAPNLNLMAPPDEVSSSDTFEQFAVPMLQEFKQAEDGQLVSIGQSTNQNQAIAHLSDLSDPGMNVMRDYRQGYPDSGMSDKVYFARQAASTARPRPRPRSRRPSPTAGSTPSRPRPSARKPAASASASPATTARPRSVIRRVLNRFRSRARSGDSSGQRPGILGRILTRVRSFFQWWLNLFMNLVMRVRGLFGRGGDGAAGGGLRERFSGLATRARAIFSPDSPVVTFFQTVRSRIAQGDSLGASDVIELITGSG